jgi:hypothetical protein
VFSSGTELGDADVDVEFLGVAELVALVGVVSSCEDSEDSVVFVSVSLERRAPYPGRSF